MSAANSNSERVHQPLPPPPLPLLPPLTINDNEYKNSKKKTKTKKRLVVDIDIGRSSIDVNIDKEKESLILVRDPPRERLARSRGPLVSADEGVHEEQLLARVAAGKQGVWYSHDHTVLGPTSTSTCASPSSSFGTNSACTTPCTTTTTTTRASTPAHRPPSQAEEFYADIYQYYYDVTKPSSPSPSPSPPPSSGRDDPSPSPSTSTFRPAQRPRPPVPVPTPIPIETPHPPSQAMSKKRGSLQAIFVPSFLQSAITSTSTSTSNSTTTTPPLTPMEVSTPVSPPPTPGLGNGHGTAKYASRIRALSAAGHASKAHANAHANAHASASASGEPHQRKRSMTFSMSLSMSSSLHAASSSFSAAPYIAPSDGASPTPRSPTTPTMPTTPATPHTHAAAHSPRSSPPPAFLIDDDPFANLTSAPCESMGLGGGGGVGRFHHPPQAQAPVVVPLPPLPAPIPRSPLYETPLLQLQPLSLPVVGAVGGAAALGASSSSSAAGLVASDAAVVASTSTSSTSTSTISSTSTSIAPSTSTSSLSKSPSSSSLSVSASLPKPPSLSASTTKPPSLSAPSSPPAPPPPTSQRPRAPAAHQRPAFSPRPSLPSLDTLARMNIVLTKKVRKGRVGAGLPFEPWDLPSDDEGTLSPPAPLPPPTAATSSSSSNVITVRHTPAMAATTPGGGNINANASNTNANTNAGQNSSQNYHPSTSTSTSISTSVITPVPVVSSSVSILSLSLSSSSLPPPPPSLFSAISSPLPSPPLPLSPALSRSASPSPSPSHVQHSPLFPLPSSPSPSTSSVTSTSSTTRSSASSTPPATATTSTFASAPTSGYVPHPHPPLPPPPALHSSMQAPTPSPVPAPVQIARPQPLLPSQILALGSIAAEVEMVVPVLAPGPGPSYIPAPAPTPVRNETAGRVGVSEGFEYAWTKPASVSVSVARTSSYAHSPAPPPTPTMGPLPVVQETEAAGLYVDVDADVDAMEEPDGYFEDFLDRYQRPSRAGSEDEHGLEFWNGAEAEAEARVRERKEYVDVGGVVNELAGQVGDAGGSSRQDASETIGAVVGAERDSFAEEYSYLYASGKLGDDGADAEGDGESTAGLSSRSRSGPGVAAAARFDSAVFSSPPSSASLSRSFSLRSDSSAGSVDSAGAVEHAGGGEREEMWSYRRFIAPSRSLSSLELDLEGEGEGKGAQGMSTESGYDVHSTEGELRRRGDSTRSSSSHPSLSRTRSSSDDSDVLQSPTPGDHDYSFFPYSHARTLAQIYQSSAGYSALFAPPVVSESFHYGPVGHGLSSSSSVEEVGGGAGAGWGGEFIAELERGISMPEGLAADTDGDGGFGFGFDKVIVAVEDQDDVVEVKEKASLATTTSIDAVQPTSTALKERVADSLQSPPSPFPCNQHDLSLSASSNLSFVESGISPLVSESDSITQPSSLISDDEMISRSNVMASGVPVRFRTTTTRPWTSGQPGDSTGYRSRGHSTTSSTSQPYRAGSSHAQTANNNASNSSYYSMGSRDYRSGRRRGDSDDEDGEEERRRRRALERMYANDGVAKIASSSSSDEDDIGTDNYGKPSASSSSKNRLAPRGTAAGSAISRSPSITGSFVTASSRSPSLKPMDFPASSKHSSSYVTEDEREEEDSSDDDDDVPLAQRIPGALTAQKTIRRQFREEREQRKREKALRMENGNAERRARQETLRPAGAGVSLHDGNGAAADSSSRDAAMHAASSVNALRRQRTTTLPGKSPTSATFNPHDLARKLQNVQLAEVSMPAYQQQQYLLQQQQQLALRQRSKSISRTSADHQQSFSPHSAASASASSPATRNRSIKDPSSQSQRQFPPASPNSQTHVPPVSSLRPMRSFHPPLEHRSAGMDDPRFKPLPVDAEQRLGRSVTSATRSHRPAAMDDPRSGALPAEAEHRLGRSATSATRNPHRRSPSQSRPSGDRGERSMEPVPPLPTNMHGRTSNDDPRRIHKVPNTTEPRISSTRTSGDVERAPRNASVQPPLPPLANKVVVSQQRVFVGNLQQFHMVEIGPSTTAGDVVTMMEAEGALTGWAGSGGWMVFEIAQDFGMERPVRSYELLADVQSSWLKDKSVNYFVLKLSPLAIPLSRNAIPTSSPTHSGYIEWEAKRGKWSKRWLQLREHNLYLAKRDNGKDEVLICSLSNFDAYTITRVHRAPKPFAFAIKSTDNLSFFENTADYLHTFSCSEKDGKIWMEKILVARSYVLHQERHILFNPKPTSNGGAAVTRAGTKKYAPIRSAQQPLVSLPPIGAAQSLPHHDVFEPGSLLAKH